MPDLNFTFLQDGLIAIRRNGFHNHFENRTVELSRHSVARALLFCKGRDRRERSALVILSLGFGNFIDLIRKNKREE